MRHFPVRALVLIALTAPLGACSSFLGINFARHAPRAAPEAAPPEAMAKAESATAVGRRQLTEGQTGLAIESFQRALSGGEPIAPAVNGLGVAYARLDRFDLAQRYFQQAIASDPANPKYADNLARLMQSPTLRMRRDSDFAQAVPSAPASLQTALAVRDTAAQPALAAPAVGKLQRVSRGEVRIATAPPQAAPAAMAHAKVDSRFRPLVRFSIAEPMARRPQSSVRVVLPESKPAEAAPWAGPGKGGARR